jgi:hypothetical protein
VQYSVDGMLSVSCAALINRGEIDRRAWECALLLNLHDELKAGNLSVHCSNGSPGWRSSSSTITVGNAYVRTFFDVLVPPPIPSRYRSISRAASAKPSPRSRPAAFTASVALRRLVGFSAKNRFYHANRDLGRIFKTEFILQYLSEPELRRRIRRGLLKVEQLHALARDVFYERRGRINARELWEQMNTCSSLFPSLFVVFHYLGRPQMRLIWITSGVPQSLTLPQQIPALI